jgi:hypothetical protein
MFQDLAFFASYALDIFLLSWFWHGLLLVLLKSHINNSGVLPQTPRRPALNSQNRMRITATFNMKPADSTCKPHNSTYKLAKRHTQSCKKNRPNTHHNTGHRKKQFGTVVFG